MWLGIVETLIPLHSKETNCEVNNPGVCAPNSLTLEIATSRT